MGTSESNDAAMHYERQQRLKQLEDIYKMFNESVQAVRTSKILESSYSDASDLENSQIRSSKIGNLKQVVDQLMDPFKQQRHPWGKDISKLFKSHFKYCFEESWQAGKEQFYRLLISHCRLEGQEEKKELQRLADNINMGEPTGFNRLSYEQIFQKDGVASLDQRVPSSIIDNDQFPWEQSFEIKSEQEAAQFNIHAINSTMLNGGTGGAGQAESSDQFLPLFLTTNPKNHRHISQRMPFLSQQMQPEVLKDMRIQNVSLVAPETIFFDRMPAQAKAQVNDLVSLYKEFANALQQMFFSSTSIVSAPFKHFLYCLKDKTARKKLAPKQYRTQSSNGMVKPAKRINPGTQPKKGRLLMGETAQSREYRKKREFNTRTLLGQIKDFAEAYTDFVWMFLQLGTISETKIGRLINIYAVYGIVLKSIWRYVQWLGHRGSQYEHKKLQQYYQNHNSPPQPKITPQKESYLEKVLKTLLGENNPQKYLKKLVVFYREAAKLCGNADELLGLYEHLVVKLIKQGLAEELSILRMPPIIEQLLRLEEPGYSVGQINYSWTSWSILIELLRDRVKSSQIEPDSPKLSRMHTEAEEYQEVYLPQEDQ